MKKIAFVLLAAALVFVALFGFLAVAHAGPAIGFATDPNSMSGDGTSSSPVGLRRTCSSNQVLRWSGTAWGCAANGSTYTAGSGLTLTTTTFAIDPTYTQRRVSGTCGAGTSIQTIAQDGSVTCGTSGIDGSGVMGYVALWSDADTLTVSSLIEDSGSVYTAKKLWSSRNDNAGVLFIGYDAASSTAADTGMAVRIESGNVKIDTKAATGGSTIFRTGSGTAHGYDNTWLTVAGNGTLDFPSVGVFDVGENNDIAAKFHGPIYLDYVLGASQVMHQAMFIGVTATLHNENELIGYNAQLDGTIDTTSTAVNVMGGQFQAITTRGAGANPVTNYGLNCNASGAQFNYCLYGSAGEIHNVNDISTSEDFVGGSNSHLQMGSSGGATESWMQGPTSTTTATQFYIHSSDLVSGPHTTGLETVGAYTDGTFATGATDKNVVAVRASATATRASGTGRVFDIGILANASGGQQNVDFYGTQGIMIQAGDAFFSSTSYFGAASDTTLAHDAVIGGALTVTTTGSFGGIVNMNSHKITNLTDGSSAQDAAAFGQIGSAVNTAVTGTTSKTTKFTGTHALGDGWASDDGTTWGTASKFTIAEASGNFHGYGTAIVDGSATLGDSTADTHTVNGKITLLPPASGRGIEIDNSLTSQTGTVQLFWGRSHGTFDTTSSDVTNYAVFGQADASRAAGANNVINVGVYGKAASGQDNRAVWADGAFLVSTGSTSAFIVDPVTQTTAVYGRVRDAGAPPTVSSCGTSPGTPTGGNWAWREIVGTGGAVTSCTFTHAASLTAAPSCQVNIESSTIEGYISSNTATAITVATRGTNDMSGLAVNVNCIGDL